MKRYDFIVDCRSGKTTQYFSDVGTSVAYSDHLAELTKLVAELNEREAMFTKKKSEAFRLKEQNKEMLEALKDISGELKLSNNQNTLEIDGCHMNILAVWDEIDNLIKKIKGE